MVWVDLIYYGSGGLLVLMAHMRSVLQIRLCHMGASAGFAGYGLIAEVWPVAVMNGGMIAVHLWRLHSTVEEV